MRQEERHVQKLQEDKELASAELKRQVAETEMNVENKLIAADEDNTKPEIVKALRKVDDQLDAMDEKAGRDTSNMKDADLAQDKAIEDAEAGLKQTSMKIEEKLNTAVKLSAAKMIRKVEGQVAAASAQLSTEAKATQASAKEEQKQIEANLGAASNVVEKSWADMQSGSSVATAGVKAALQQAEQKLDSTASESSEEAAELKKFNLKQSARVSEATAKLRKAKVEVQEQLASAGSGVAGVGMLATLQSEERRVADMERQGAKQQKRMQEITAKEETDASNLSADVAAAQNTVSQAMQGLAPGDVKATIQSMAQVDEQLNAAVSVASREHVALQQLVDLRTASGAFGKLLWETKGILKKKMEVATSKEEVDSARSALQNVEGQIAAIEMKQVQHMDEIAASKITLGKAYDALKRKARLKGQLVKARSAKSKAELETSVEQASKELQTDQMEEIVKLEQAASASKAATLINTKAKIEQELVTAAHTVKHRLEKALEKVDAQLAITIPDISGSQRVAAEITRARADTATERMALQRTRDDLEVQLASPTNSKRETAAVDRSLSNVVSKIETLDLSKMDETAASKVVDKLLKAKHDLKLQLEEQSLKGGDDAIAMKNITTMLEKVDNQLAAAELQQRARMEKATASELSKVKKQAGLKDRDAEKIADEVIKTLTSVADVASNNVQQRIAKLQQQAETDAKLEGKVAREEAQIKAVEDKVESAKTQNDAHAILKGLHQKEAQLAAKDAALQDKEAASTLAEQLVDGKVALEEKLATAKFTTDKAEVTKALEDFRANFFQHYISELHGSPAGKQLNVDQAEDVEAILMTSKATYKEKLDTVKQNVTSAIAAADQQMKLVEQTKRDLEEAKDDHSKTVSQTQSLVAKERSTRAQAVNVEDKVEKDKEQLRESDAALVASEKQLAVASAKTNLAKQEAVCGNGLCPEAAGLQAKVAEEAAAMKEAVNAADVKSSSSLSFKCGDGMFQNENGEECDDGNLEAGDGCDGKCAVEKGWSCGGGSWSHRSLCDKCGNGVQLTLEECDDGNLEDGDGCSNQCRIEPGYTCTPSDVVGDTKSRCQQISKTDIEKVMTKLKHANDKCSRDGQLFMAHDAESDLGEVGSCVDKAAATAQPQVRQQSRSAMSALSGFSTHTIGRVGTRLTCPVPLQSLGGGAPYAVCSEVLYEVCRSTAGSDRVCQFQKSVKCEEVCIAPRFCKSKNVVTGQLVHRHHGPAHTPTNKACCFKHCIVPKHWTAQGMPITPEKWCLPVAYDV